MHSLTLKRLGFWEVFFGTNHCHSSFGSIVFITVNVLGQYVLIDKIFKNDNLCQLLPKTNMRSFDIKGGNL
jgi:hypothetical protein